MATHSNILAWRIPRAQKPGRLQSTGSQESDMTERLSTHTQCKVILRYDYSPGICKLTHNEILPHAYQNDHHQMCVCVCVCVCVKPLQSCLTLCDPMDCCLPGSSVHGILQARILEWDAIPFSKGSSQPRD